MSQATPLPRSIGPLTEAAIARSGGQHAHVPRPGDEDLVLQQERLVLGDALGQILDQGLAQPA